MNDIQTKLLEQASGILSGISNTVSKAADIASEQMPEVATSYVAFGRAIETSLVMFGVVIFLATLIVAIRHKDNEAAVCLGIFGVPIGLLIVAANLSGFYMVWLAPKVWLIKEIVHLIK